MQRQATLLVILLSAVEKDCGFAGQYPRTPNPNSNKDERTSMLPTLSAPAMTTEGGLTVAK